MPIKNGRQRPWRNSSSTGSLSPHLLLPHSNARAVRFGGDGCHPRAPKCKRRLRKHQENRPNRDRCKPVCNLHDPGGFSADGFSTHGRYRSLRFRFFVRSHSNGALGSGHKYWAEARLALVADFYAYLWRPAGAFLCCSSAWLLPNAARRVRMAADRGNTGDRPVVSDSIRAFGPMVLVLCRRGSQSLLPRDAQSRNLRSLNSAQSTHRRSGHDAMAATVSGPSRPIETVD